MPGERAEEMKHASAPKDDITLKNKQYLVIVGMVGSSAWSPNIPAAHDPIGDCEIASTWLALASYLSMAMKIKITVTISNTIPIDLRIGSMVLVP